MAENESGRLLLSLGAYVSGNDLFSASLVEADAARQIINAAGYPIALSQDHAEMLVQALGGIAHELIVAPKPATKEQVDAVRRTWLAFAKAASTLGFTTEAVPDPGVMVLVGQWVSSLPTRERGSPPIQSDRVLYPLLLSTFCVIYGKAPASTIGGPAARFVSEFGSQLDAALRKLDRKLGTKSMPIPSWLTVNASGIAKKIERHGATAESDAFMASLAAELASRGG